MDLKAELEKARATARVAKEVAEASRQASYNLEVEERGSKPCRGPCHLEVEAA